MNEDRYRGAERKFWQHYGASPTETWLDLEKPATKVRVLEVGGGPPVLFLHGGPAAASIFAPLAAQMTNVRCLLVDRPGCGLSPAIDYSSLGVSLDDLMAGIIFSTIDALGLDRADIVANSFGGACALWFAQRQPNRVAKIALTGCPAFVSQMKISTFLKLLSTPGVGLLMARLPFNKMAVRLLMNSMGQAKAMEEGRLPEQFVDWWVSLGRDTPTMQNERELIRHGLTWRGMRPELVFEDEAIRRIGHSMYLYWGADDPFATTKFAAGLVEGMSNATLDIVPAGHLPWLDDPTDAAKRVRAFLIGDAAKQS